MAVRFSFYLLPFTFKPDSLSKAVRFKLIIKGKPDKIDDGQILVNMGQVVSNGDFMVLDDILA